MSRSLIVALVSSDLELLKDKVAKGERSDLAIVTSFSDCSYSNLDIIKFGLLIFEISTDELKDLPQAGSPVFLELDYKSNTQFLVGVYVNYPQSVIQKDLLWINPKQEWNKIYVNLTTTISEGINASSFKVFIGMRRDFDLEKNELYFDNIKVVY